MDCSTAGWHDRGADWVAFVAMVSLRCRCFVAAVAAATLLVGTFASPALGATSSPTAWAKSVCGALDSWTTNVGAASAKSAKAKPTSAVDVRKKLTALLATTETETKSLIARLNDAGQPDVKGGKQIAATMRDGYAQVLRIVVGSKKSLAKVSIKDPVAFTNAVRGVQDSLESGLEGVQAAFSAVRTADAPTLLAAFAADSRCKHVAA
jgi:hypothetical protein